MRLLFYERGNIKYLASYCLLSQEKIKTAKKFKKISQFSNDVGKNTLDIGEKQTLARWVKNTVDVYFI